MPLWASKVKDVIFGRIEDGKFEQILAKFKDGIFGRIDGGKFEQILAKLNNFPVLLTFARRDLS